MYNSRNTPVIPFILTVIGTASCDLGPVSPEEFEERLDQAATSGDTSESGIEPRDESPHHFHFHFALVDEGAYEIRSRLREHADRWARIVEGSDPQNIAWEPGVIRCGGLEYDFQHDVVDDVVVLVSVRGSLEDGRPGIRSQVCGFRDSSKLPLIGALTLYLDGLSESDADDLILHGLGHMLGFGNSWPRLGLLHDPASRSEGADPHFVGAGAIATFVAAGGAAYRGRKVPVEDDTAWGTVDTHWRESVFGTELMSSGLREGVSDQLSAVTIQSLADIGYTVDVEEADAFVLPGANAAARAAENRTAIDLTGDVVIGPAVFYDRHGRVTRVVRPK